MFTGLGRREHPHGTMGDLRRALRMLRPGGALCVGTLLLDRAGHLLPEDGWKLPGRGHVRSFEARVPRGMLR